MSVPRLGASQEVDPAAYNRLLSGQSNDGLVYYGDTTGWRLPWSMPWGEQAPRASNAVAQTTSGGTELVILTSTAFTAVPNRRLLVVADFTGFGSTVADTIRFTVRRGTTITDPTIKVGPAFGVTTANYRLPFMIEAEDTTPAAGSLQYVVGAARLSVSGTFTMEASGVYANGIKVIDVGPSGAAPTS